MPTWRKAWALSRSATVDRGEVELVLGFRAECALTRLFPQSTKAVYDRILDLRIATPQIVINYAMFLEEHKYFEESFKAYERGISLFKWPNVSDIWSTYLTKFISRYGGRKLERARDLFEQALDGCPPKYAKSEESVGCHGTWG